MRIKRTRKASRFLFWGAILFSTWVVPACLVERDVFSDDPRERRPLVASVCGNGTLEGLETCDDGNAASGDGCSAACLVEPCFSCAQTDGGASCMPVAEGDPCPDGVCTATAQCVACTSDSHCAGSGERCFVNTCVSCTNGVLDGDEVDVDCGGSCLACNGTPCGDASACKSNFCTDNYCCNEACGEVCRSCNRTGEEGICGNIAAGATDDAPLCFSKQACNGGGQCLAAPGEPCNSGTDCASGQCLSTSKKCK